MSMLPLIDNVTDYPPPMAHLLTLNREERHLMRSEQTRGAFCLTVFGVAPRKPGRSQDSQTKMLDERGSSGPTTIGVRQSASHGAGRKLVLERSWFSR